MKKFILFLLLTAVVSCKDSAVTRNQKLAFDNLEKVFGSANWRHVNYGDTVYLSFSREGDTSYKICNYRFADGDSVETTIINIHPHRDSILMKVGDNTRVLTKSDETGNTWKYGEVLFEFKKIDSSSIVLREDGRIVDTLRRTLPINEFLKSVKQAYHN